MAIGHMRTLAWCAALVLAVGMAGCSDSDNDVQTDTDTGTSAPQRDTAQGPVAGVAEDRQLSFKGIPYAAAPTGERRFAPPQPAPQRDNVLQADAFGSPCPQGGGTFGLSSTDENCLFLNVYTPKTEGSYPVMVWIHGGAFVTGSGGRNYNPVRLVQKGVVVVTINYRLGVLGFLANPALSAENDANASGDYGLMDQQAALQWVQDNIANFGGDPDNVTIFGESAGGHSVLSQVASPEASDLFDKAIVESGSYSPTQRTLAQAENQGQQIADALGCSGDDVAACLRNASVADIVDAEASFDFVPNTRPDLLPESIAQALASGDYSQVPIIEGTNRNEGQLFIAIDELTRDSAFGPDDYRPQIAAMIGQPENGAAVDAIVGEYPLADYDNTGHALAAIFTDSVFACNGLAQVGTLAPRESTYAYEFADPGAPNLIPPSPSFPDYGAPHAFEIAYVLNTEAAMRDRGAGDAQIALSNTMIDYWTSFAKNGDPNPSSGTDTFWPTFDTDGGTYLQLVAPDPKTLSSADFGTEHHCDFWASFGAG